jgi:hypothetical protein
VETVDVVRTETRLNLELLSLQAETPLSLRWGTVRGCELEIVGGRVKSRAGMTGMEGRRGAVEEFVGRSGRVMEGAGFGEGIVRRESREKRMRRGVGAGASNMGLQTRDEHCVVEIKRVETYGKRKGCLEACDLVEEEALRLRLADRMDWDSAKSRERNERNCCSSR